MQQDADFECVECGSQSFRTNESQELVCEECGTLSQLTMPESHEAADAAEARGKAGRAYRLRKGEESQGKPQAAALDVKDCLLAYQYVLKALAESMVRQLGCPGEVVEVVEDLWFSYLEEWTAKARYPILQCFLQAKKKSSTKVLRKYDSVAGMVAFRKKRAIENPSRQERIELDRAIRGQAAAAAASHDEEEEDQGSTERAEEASQKGGKRRAVRSRKGGPLLQGDISEYAALSLKLGMAFLDAAARQLRLGIMPAHLLRWVEEGSIPLFTAWQYVPQELWSRLDRVWGFFVVKQTTKPHMLASLTARLTFALDLSLPEPNLAVCCQRLVWDMGLPEHVASSCIALLNHHSSVASMRNRQQAPPRDGECSFGQYVWKHSEDPAVPVALVLISSRLDRKWPYWAYHRGPARGGGEAEMVMVESEEEALQLRRKDLEGYLRYVSDVVLAGEPVWPDDDTHRTLLEGIAGRPRMHTEEAEDEDEELLSSSLPPPVVREAAGVAITGPSQPHRLYDPKDKDGPPVDDGLWALVEHAARAVEVAPAYLLQVTLTLEDKLLGPFQEKGANKGRTQRWWDADIHRNLKWAERFGMDIWAGQSQAQSEGEEAGGREEGEEEGSGDDGDDDDGGGRDGGDDDDDGDVDDYDDGDDGDGSDNERPGEGDGSKEDSH